MTLSRTSIGMIVLIIIAIVQVTLFIMTYFSRSGDMGSFSGLPLRLPRVSLVGSFDNSREEYIPALYERIAPSVVYIDSDIGSSHYVASDSSPLMGGGSGFVWDYSGHVVTNYHVVQNSRTARVTLLAESISLQPPSSEYQNNSSEYQNKPPANHNHNHNHIHVPITQLITASYTAQVIGIDPIKDIALLQLLDVPKHHLHPVNLGSSSSVRVGQTALAIGSPFGLDHSLTAGIISGLNRKVRSPSGRPISNVLQTDAAVNPGNSGGPLFDNKGAVVGMNTAIYSPSGASAGVAFAIPIDTVRDIVSTLVRHGKVTRASLGISFLETEGAATSLGIRQGVLVLDVPKNSPAYSKLRGTQMHGDGKMRLGDVIVMMDRFEIETEEDLFFVLEMYTPGERVKLVVERTVGGQWSVGQDRQAKQMNVWVTLVESGESVMQL